MRVPLVLLAVLAVTGCDVLAGRTLGPATCTASHAVQRDTLTGLPDTIATIRYCTAR